VDARGFCSFSVPVSVFVCVSSERDGDRSVNECFVVGDRSLLTRLAACDRASNTLFASDHSPNKTLFLARPSITSNLRMMRGPYVAQSSSPKPLSVARSIGSADTVQSSVCHAEARRYRNPILAAGCITWTLGEPLNRSIWNGIHFCHFLAKFSLQAHTLFSVARPTETLKVVPNMLSATGQGNDMIYRQELSSSAMGALSYSQNVYPVSDSDRRPCGGSLA